MPTGKRKEQQMSTQEIGFSTLEAGNAGDRQLATRVVTKTISVIVGLAGRIVEEVVYTIREDLKHGRIQREPEDWER
jgi:hypothetical protein